MPITKRYIPLVLIGLLSACINVPEIEPSPPDSGTQPDAGTPEDTVLPSITRSTPASGSTNVALNTGLEFEFSEPMDIDTVQVSSSPPIPLEALTWSLGNTRLVIQPASSLAHNAPYTLTVVGKDVAGNELTGNRTISFTTTGPAPDTTPPMALGFAPSNSATGVDRMGAITILFSEPMDQPSVQSAFAITSPIGFNSGAFIWNDAGTEMTFRPNRSFDHGVDINWQVSVVAKDASGNALQTAIAGTFRTLRLNTITIDFDRETSGSLSAPGYHGIHFYNLECVGDASGNKTNRLFVGFKLDALPEDTKNIIYANLKWWVSGQAGDPFNKFGQLLLEQVNIGDKRDFNSIEGDDPDPEAAQDFHAIPLSPAIIAPSNIDSSHGGFDVTNLVQNDWMDRATRNRRTQFRLRFEKESDDNNASDWVCSDAERHPKLAELKITYEYP
ncbi:Ig-like domain-containing protein [Archangium violaceum]|uniref:Ig-like domain-containing protein n=1 Tax=Archangium violaceum TaxID=83451 RepID=UPI00193C3CF1|nr:Ig-like domain-containing protein [Archangium violaceum]QRK05706.1 Ig-like domain-containing protein [Archangium violaceum]